MARMISKVKRKDLRTVGVMVRVTTGERNLLAKRAKAHGLTLSSWMRMILWRELEKKRDAQGGEQGSEKSGNAPHP